MSRGKIIAAVIGLIVVGVVVAGVIISARGSAPEVATATAQSETLGVKVTASGKIEASTKYDVAPASAGLIESVEVTEGARVTAGQVLATLDPDAARLAVTQAEAGVKAARAQVETVKNTRPNSYDRAAADAALRAAQLGYDSAKAAYDGWLLLNPPPSGEPTTTNLKLAMLNAEAGLHSAQSAAQKAGLCMNDSLAAAYAGVTSAEHALELAQQQLNDMALVAPADGIVIFNALGTPGADGTMPKAQKGSAISAAAAPFTVVQLGTVTFNAQVDEADIDRVKTGMKAEVQLDAFPSDSLKGTVTTVKTAAVQTTTGGIAFPVLISLTEPDKNILLGMSGSTDIEVSAVSGAITVPIEALFDEDGDKYVFTYDAGKLAKVKVTTGALTDTQAQILSGVPAGSEVVVGNLSSLKDGMAVRKK